MEAKGHSGSLSDDGERGAESEWQGETDVSDDVANFTESYKVCLLSPSTHASIGAQKLAAQLLILLGIRFRVFREFG